jgi:hypothetical protein
MIEYSGYSVGFPYYSCPLISLGFTLTPPYCKGFVVVEYFEDLSPPFK